VDVAVAAVLGVLMGERFRAVGLTGGISTGKSTVSKLLRAKVGSSCVRCLPRQ
jgi:uridine kinase